MILKYLIKNFNYNIGKHDFQYFGKLDRLSNDVECFYSRAYKCKKCGVVLFFDFFTAINQAAYSPTKGIGFEFKIKNKIIFINISAVPYCFKDYYEVNNALTENMLLEELSCSKIIMEKACQ